MMEGVTPGMIVGVNTEVIAGEKMIITSGAIDAHGAPSFFFVITVAREMEPPNFASTFLVHFICPQLWTEVSTPPLLFRIEFILIHVSLHLGDCQRYHYAHRRRNWPRSRNERHHLHSFADLHENDDGRHRWNPSQLWLHGKRKR